MMIFPEKPHFVHRNVYYRLDSPNFKNFNITIVFCKFTSYPLHCSVDNVTFKTFLLEQN